MKVVIFLALIGLAVAYPQANRQYRPAAPRPAAPAPQPGLKTSEITNLRSEFENDGLGTYNYGYENSDGTSVSQRGQLKPPPPGEQDPILDVEGFYRYYDPLGEFIDITYTANENGYNAQGAAIPTSPPIPEAILKSLNINVANAERQRSQSQGQRGRL